MAEINIEKKSPKWPWVLLILAVIGVLVYLFAFDDDESTAETIEETTEEPAETRPEVPKNSFVIAYVNFVSEDSDSMSLDHEFTNNALLRLTNATEEMAGEINYDIKKEIAEVKRLSEKVASDPFETTHANSIKDAAEILAQSLQNIQQNAYPDFATEANEVKTAAADIKNDVHTLEQKENVKNFFRESADLLEKMNNNSPEMQSHVRKQ